MFKSPCYTCQYQFQENVSRVMGHCFPLTWYQAVHLETTTTLRASRPQGNNFFGAVKYWFSVFYSLLRLISTCIFLVF